MKTQFLELIRRTSTQLPDDVVAALKRAHRRETQGTPAKHALAIMVQNLEMAQERSTPICQDTGSNIWHIHHPQSVSTLDLTRHIHAATVEARKRAYLRPNAVNAVTGVNTGNNLGDCFPTLCFKEWKKKSIVVDLMMKGGGCENVSTQYALPHRQLEAGRDLEGVRRVVLDAVFQAQGWGCAPGILGVGIGGDRITGMMEAKHQLFRLLHDKNPDKTLARLENRLMKETNQLEIGPMGYGGKSSVLAVKVGAVHRVPASYFVSISYMCWACRRSSVKITPSGKATYGQVSELARQYDIKGGGR